MGSFSFLHKNDHFSNRAVFFSNGQILNTYDKTHLFKPMKEDIYFKRGNGYSVFGYKNWKIGLNICYDLRFPEAQRSLYHLGADLIIIPAAWPYFKVDIMKKLAIARAIENQLYIIVVNRAASSLERLDYGGNSLIISPEGKVLLELDHFEAEGEQEIDLEKVRAYRNSLNCFNDRRDDIYISRVNE